MTWELVSKLRNELSKNVELFNDTHSRFNIVNVDNLNLTIKEYEHRINVSLELQYTASYVVAILYKMIGVVKSMLRKGGSISDQSKVKQIHDELNLYLDEYKSHVYNFSQRAKTLCDLLKTKQMAQPDIYRG